MHLLQLAAFLLMSLPVTTAEGEPAICDNNPCLNGGTCSVWKGLVSCKCAFPQGGRFCEISFSDPDPCSELDCVEGEVCLAQTDCCAPEARCFNASALSAFYCSAHVAGVYCTAGANCYTDSYSHHRCICRQGFSGSDCEIPVVPCTVGRYGTNCDQTCNCPNRQTQACDRDSGMCTAPCTVGRYGSNCDQTCNCPNRQTQACNRDSGVCTAPCFTEYTGPNCQAAVSCTVGRYGTNCDQTCNCPNRQTQACDRDSGVCTAPCITGYTGPSCQPAVPCTVGRYGTNCEQTCNCPNRQTQACDRDSGVCTAPCITGYTGPSCQPDVSSAATTPRVTTPTTPCPVGQYGTGCVKTCDCVNRETRLCERLSGVCLSPCVPEYSGQDCQTDVQVVDPENSPSPTLIAGVAVGCCLVVLAVISIVIFVLRRRMSQPAITSENAHKPKMNSVISGDQAIYIDEPENLPEASSAVYENQPVSVRGDGSTVMNLYDHLDGEMSASVYTTVGNPQNMNLYDHRDGQTSAPVYTAVGNPQNTDDSDGYCLPVV